MKNDTQKVNEQSMFFRMLKKSLSPFFIEALIDGGYHHFSYIGSNDDIYVEWYILDKIRTATFKKGLNLYRNAKWAEGLIADGEKLSAEINKFIPFLLRGNQFVKNRREIKKSFVRTRNYFIKLAEIYSYTEDTYSGKVQQIIRDFILKKVGTAQNVNFVLSQLLDSSAENMHYSAGILRSFKASAEIENLCRSVKIIGRGKFILRPTLNSLWLLLVKILKSMAKEINFPLDLMGYCVYGEIIALLNELGDGGKILKDAQDRNDAFFVFRKKGKLALLSGDLARKMAQAVKNPVLSSRIQNFKGDIVSVGYAKGRVVVLPIGADKGSKNELNKKIRNMKKGDIIVAQATGPEMTLAFKKAGAIICEWGGITSHAAVISREFKIPGIINTKIATKVLRDGDLVEVDANKGIVKILKNN